MDKYELLCWLLQDLRGKFLESNPDAASLAALGKASRVVFDWMSQGDGRINWLASRVIPYVAKTFGTDPAASSFRLRQVIEGDRFARPALNCIWLLATTAANPANLSRTECPSAKALQSVCGLIQVRGGRSLQANALPSDP